MWHLGATKEGSSCQLQDFPGDRPGTRQQMGVPCPFLHVNLKSTPIILCATDVQGEIPVVLKGFQRCEGSRKMICLKCFTKSEHWSMPLRLFK